MAEFTQDWNREFKENTKGIKVDFALEIGCFEGLTTNYICDNLLSKEGRIICIDPLPDDHNTLPFGEDNKIFEGQYDRFVRNTRGRPVELIRKKSDEAFDRNFRDYRFGLIYIDGDHREDAAARDRHRGGRGRGPRRRRQCAGGSGRGRGLGPNPADRGSGARGGCLRPPGGLGNPASAGPGSDVPRVPARPPGADLQPVVRGRQGAALRPGRQGQGLGRRGDPAPPCSAATCAARA